MTNEEKIHRIFIDEEGRELAERIRNSFDRGSYRVQFELHEVESTNMMDILESGVSILLLKPQLLDAIAAGNHPKLVTLFPNPKFSIVLCHCMDKSKSQVSKILSSKLNGFLHWTYINFCSHDDFKDLKLNIMSLVEKSEGVEDVPMTPKLQNFKLWPGQYCKPKQSILLLFARPVDDDETVRVMVIQEDGSLTLDTQRLNSMTYSFNVGDMVAGMKTTEVYVNKSNYGRVNLHVESKMVELEHLLHDSTNAIELMCQSLHCKVTIKDLDRELQDLLSNCPSSTLNSLFSKLDWDRFGETVSKSELPTLLHFGAKFGLVDFCRKLIALPGCRQAMWIKNKNNLVPHEIAEQNGFRYLASQLEGKDDSIYMPLVSPIRQYAQEDSVFNYGSATSKGHKEKVSSGSCDSGIQMLNGRCSEHSSTPSHGNTSRDSFHNSSSSGSNFVPSAIKPKKSASHTDSGKSSGSTSSPRLTGYTNRMTKLLDDDEPDSISQCMESKLHMETTKL